MLCGCSAKSYGIVYISKLIGIKKAVNLNAQTGNDGFSGDAGNRTPVRSEDHQDFYLYSFLMEHSPAASGENTKLQAIPKKFCPAGSGTRKDYPD